MEIKEKKMKKIIVVLMVALFALIPMAVFAGGTQEPTTDQKDRIQQEQMFQEAQREVGLPAITNFQEKKLFKYLYELRDQAKVITYVYSEVMLTGKFRFIGRAIGFPIPYATQYSNPEKHIGYADSREYGYELPQAEPNGLFMPSSAAGTWVVLLEPGTQKPIPAYFEPNMTCTLFPLPDAVVEK
jgi:hypothetical protein